MIPFVNTHLSSILTIIFLEELKFEKKNLWITALE